jgi:uncharacterized membrane protein
MWQIEVIEMVGALLLILGLLVAIYVFLIRTARKQGNSGKGKNKGKG